MRIRTSQKNIARAPETARPARSASLLLAIAFLALALAASTSWANDWMPQVENEAPDSFARQPSSPNAKEPDIFKPLDEKPDRPAQAASRPAAGGGIGIPVLVSYSALNRDLKTLTRGKPLALKSKCDALTLKSPKLGMGGQEGTVTLSCPVTLLTGAKKGNACRTTKKWKGRMQATFRVDLARTGEKLSFKPKGLILRGPGNSRAPSQIAQAADRFPGLISRNLLARLSLQKHIPSSGRMVSGLFEDAGDWLNDLDRPEGWRIRKVNTVRAGLEVSLEAKAGVRPGRADQAMTEQEMLGLWSGWESWDNYLVGVCKSVGKAKLNRGQQDRLLTALLDNRYAMAANRGQKKLDPARVRSQIEATWQEIKPVVAQVTARSGEAKAGSLTKIMAAGDTLTGALNQDPTLAAKIKPRGLDQVFGPGPKAKKQSSASDDFLRDALGLGPDAKEDDWGFGDEPPEVEKWPVPSISEKPVKGRKKPPKTTKPPVSGAPVKRSEWVPDLRSPKAYVTKVRALMAQTADQVLKKGGPATKYRDLFREIVAATAWQESCWIHYVRKKDGRIAILGSYDKKSAGIMQINFQVWKGIYNTDLLRKSIRYNAKAGCEILKLYMERYALRKMDKKNPPPPDLLARSIYSMYNGGPSQFTGFFRRLNNHKLWKSEKLWNQKFERVKAGQWDKIKGCMPATARWAD